MSVIVHSQPSDRSDLTDTMKSGQFCKQTPATSITYLQITPCLSRSAPWPPSLPHAHLIQSSQERHAAGSAGTDLARWLPLTPCAPGTSHASSQPHGPPTPWPSRPSLTPHPHLLRCRPRQACRRRISCPFLCALVPAPNISTPPPPRHLLHPLPRLLPLTAAGYVLLPWRRRFRIVHLLLPHYH